MTTVPEGAVKAGTLWAVNIHGPDDLIAAPDYMSAVRMANAFNAWWLNLKAKQPHNDALDARMWAVPTDWPGNDAQGHADELSKPHPEYQWLRDASALPHLPGVGVKTLPRAPKDQSDIGWTLPIHLLEELRKEADSWADEISIEGVEAIALSTERRILSALEPSTAPVQVFGNSEQLISPIDMGNPITDKTVKMVLAEAIAQVWYQTRDCDVEEIDRIIAHLMRNGLLIVGSQRFRMMADAIQSAAAYLALSQPNSAEKLIAELDEALNCETVRVDQLSGNSGQLIESLIKDADWLVEYGHQLHEECDYHDGGSTANRLQAIGDRISKLIETVIPVSDEVDSTEVGIPATEPSTASKMEVVADLPELLERLDAGLEYEGWMETDGAPVELFDIEAAQDLFADAAAAIRALSSPDHADAGKVEGDGWMPIESAPKDGKIDIWATDNDGKGRRVTDCYYDRICDEWRTSAPALRLHCVKARYVTHWRRLPTPPSGEVA